MALTLKQLRDKANARLTPFFKEVSDKQDAYFAKHGKYFQKLITNQPKDEEEVDWSDNAPADEKHSKDAELATAGGKLPFAIKIDEFVGPDNTAGWSMTCTVKLSDDTMYRRKRDNEGNDTNWELYDPAADLTP